MKALVIGGGIGGLSAAVGLKNAGIHCEVFEAVKEIKPVGAAISIWPERREVHEAFRYGQYYRELRRPDAFSRL
ncbi:putative flavoprotein monooxygenase [Klebsiella michiganensis]|nr:putative flavoprotein monooxygenase [Klebsiella michiganensis]